MSPTDFSLFDASQQGKVVDTCTQRIAFRRARVVQEKLVDQDGLTFLFEINNIRIFCGGSNWIPADSFLTKYVFASGTCLTDYPSSPQPCLSVTTERYRAWLQLLVDGNQNMVRVWGGGVYEPDIFYDICDGKLSRTYNKVA